MIILLARFKSNLSHDEVLQVMRKRAPQFRAISGLIQKHYIHDRETGEYGGMYFWDCEDSKDEYKKSSLAKTIADAYKTSAPPRIEIMDTVYTLRA